MFGRKRGGEGERKREIQVGSAQRQGTAEREIIIMCQK